MQFIQCLHLLKMNTHVSCVLVPFANCDPLIWVKSVLPDIKNYDISFFFFRGQLIYCHGFECLLQRVQFNFHSILSLHFLLIEKENILVGRKRYKKGALNTSKKQNKKQEKLTNHKKE